MIEHYAGRYADSAADLEEGERLIEAAFSKSVTQEISTYIVNDNARDYAGEDYEDLYINVFNALNYYHQGDLEGALVEIRRLTEKLSYLEDKYETARDKIESSGALGGAGPATEASRFSNSALARYLGVLFYRARGRSDDARIDLEELREAYALAPAVYPNPLPRSLDGELSIPPGEARLNVLAFTGLAPVKEEVSVLVPLLLPPPNDWARLALPELRDRPSAVTRIAVRLDTGETCELELLEDMSRVARETFKSKYALIVLKTVARMLAKSTVTAGIGAVLDDQVGEGWGYLFGLLGGLTAAASEQADLRSSRYFPGRAYVGALNLPEGVYSLTISYYGSGGLLAAERRENVPVRAGALNLLEFTNLR